MEQKKNMNTPSENETSQEEQAVTRTAGRATGYVPPPRLLQRLMTYATDEAGQKTVTLPAEAFTLLLEAALKDQFDEELYLERHEDVREGVKSSSIVDAMKQFAMHGYFERRLPPKYPVDEKWYLATYPDVEGAIRDGEVVDATDHFNAFGFAESRVPCPEYQEIIGEWMALSLNKGSSSAG